MLDTQVFPDSLARQASFLPPPFTCSWTNGDGLAAWVRLTGDLDISTSPELKRTLRDAQGRAQIVVVDLRRVTFADSSAVHVLLDASRRARSEGRRLVVLRAPAHVDRIFTLSGVRDAIQFVYVDAGESRVDELLRRVTEERELGSQRIAARPQETG